MTSLAVDIGGESGRVIAGHLVDGRLQIDEVARFPNGPIQVDGTTRWDIEGLIGHVRQGLAAFAGPVASVGVDTWGVDYVLLDKVLNLVEPPFHYRDARTNGVMERMASAEIYMESGIQFLPFNTIFQLAATPASTFERAAHFMTIPDYIHFCLSSERRIASEFTNATTTQLLNAKTGTWSPMLLDLVGTPPRIFPEIVQPGTTLGTVDGLGAKLIAPACHDTGSAVAAIPSTSPNVVWISSGTWSLLGVERPGPIISEESYRLNYTNEGGVYGTTRLLKNVMGLWILQECRRDWGGIDYGILMQEALMAQSLGVIFDVDDPAFLSPSRAESRMEERIVAWMRERGLAAPSTRGETVRLVLESLAHKYAVLIRQLSELTGTKFEAVHIFGGGCQNELLNQLTADACGIPVVAGPVEATAIGNLLVQMITLGEIGSLAEGRQIVRDSFAVRTFLPE